MAETMGNKQATPNTQLFGEHQISPSLVIHVAPGEVLTPKGKVGCYVISSKGLPQHHPEIVISICYMENFRFNVVINLFAALEQAAKQGNVVQPGGVTSFGAPVFEKFHGILYAQAIPAGDIIFPNNYLMGFFVTKDELRIVNNFGGMRLLSLFANSYLYYPYPPFNDFNRPQMGAFDWSKSILCHVGGKALSHCYFTRIDQQNILRMSISRSHINECKATLDSLAGLPIGIRANNISSEADSCLFWKPGQQETCANGLGNSTSKIAGCFLILLPNQPNNDFRLIEDGFVYNLQDDAWSAVKNALVTGENLTVTSTTPGSCHLQICWTDPITEKPLPASITLDHVEFLEMEQLDRCPQMSEPLVKFIKDIDEKVQGHIKQGPEPMQIRIEMVLSPSEPTRYELLARPSLPEEAGGLHQALQQISSPTVPFTLHVNLVFDVAMKLQ